MIKLTDDRAMQRLPSSSRSTRPPFSTCSVKGGLELALPTFGEFNRQVSYRIAAAGEAG